MILPNDPISTVSVGLIVPKGPFQVAMTTMLHQFPIISAESVDAILQSSNVVSFMVVDTCTLPANEIIVILAKLRQQRQTQSNFRIIMLTERQSLVDIWTKSLDIIVMAKPVWKRKLLSVINNSINGKKRKLVQALNQCTSSLTDSPFQVLVAEGNGNSSLGASRLVLTFGLSY